MTELIDRINLKLIRWVIGNYLSIPVTAFLLIEGVLKEMPLFWRNEGGYPVAFRHWVLYSFYPSFFLIFAWLCLLTFGTLRHAKWVRKHPIITALPLGVAWTLLGITGIVVITDNLQNLLNGDTLHAPRGIGPD